MELDLQREHTRRTYQLCRVAFGLISGALIVACVTTFLSLLELSRPFGGAGMGVQIRDSLIFKWSDLPVTWGCLIGTYLLWGRWHDPSWQRRTGLLVIMSGVDVVLWLLEHESDLGLRLERIGHEHEWFRAVLGQALGWCEFALMASLAGDFLFHLGVDEAPDAGKATLSLAKTGFALWLVVFLLTTDWHHVWPLQRRPIAKPEVFFLYMGSIFMWSITLVQVTALTLAATRRASRSLAEMDREDQHHDLLRSPSESEADWLSSRNDGRDDDFWKA